jgi:hypothetical protein
MKKEHIKSCSWNVAVYGSDTGTVGKNDERVINAFEAWCWRRMLKIKWTDRITNEEVIQRAKEVITFTNFRNRCHSRTGHTIRHNEFVVNILEGAISGKKAMGRLRLQYLKQVTRNTGTDSYTAIKRMAYNSSRWKAANQSQD